MALGIVSGAGVRMYAAGTWWRPTGSGLDCGCSWPTSEPAPEHGPEGQRERAVAKEARGSIPTRTNRDSSSLPGTAPRSASPLPPALLNTVPARSCACVSEMLAASPKQLRGMYGEGSKVTMCPVFIATGCKCVKQFACDFSSCFTLFCRALWKSSWVHTGGGRHHVSEIVQPPGERCGQRRHLLEARGERPTGAHVVGTRCATAQDVLSGWAMKRVGQCRCGWFPCGCSFSFTVERFGHQEIPSLALCVSPCVFLLCHRWEAGHQEGARTVPCRHRSCPRCLALPRGSAASLQGRSLLQRRVLNAWRFE